MGVRLTDNQQELYSQMSKMRCCIEWGFGKISKLFAFLDFKENVKLLLQPIGKYYLVAGILINCHTSMYGYQTGPYFDLGQPTVEAYLADHLILSAVIYT